jgi:hypothetical protein
MMKMSDGQESFAFANFPPALVSRAQQDVNFALRLLNRATRDRAIREAGLELTDEQRRELFARLDEVASLSFQEALKKLRDEGFGLLI